MAGLTTNDIAILDRYVFRGERLAYWNYLDAVSIRETGQHNAYAVLAAQVVQNNTFDSAVANRYAATLTGIERLSFSDISGVGFTLAANNSTRRQAA